MKKHIFIVDDDEAILDVIKIILDDNGFKTTIITDGDTFFNRIKTQRPDLILLDIWLTGIDGIEITKRLKTKPQLKKIPVIMISANNKGKQLALESGADGFLAKPFEIDDLLMIVNKYLQPQQKHIIA